MTDTALDNICLVHLTQHRGGWSVSVSRGGRAAADHGEVRAGALALATAKALALHEHCGIVIVTLDEGFVHVEPADVPSYTGPPPVVAQTDSTG